MKSQSIAHLLRGREHIYWIIGLQSELHSIWDVWRDNLQERKDDFWESGGVAKSQASTPDTPFPPWWELAHPVGSAQIAWALAPTLASKWYMELNNVILLTFSTTLRTQPILLANHKPPSKGLYISEKACKLILSRLYWKSSANLGHTW